MLCAVMTISVLSQWKCASQLNGWMCSRLPAVKHADSQYQEYLQESCIWAWFNVSKQKFDRSHVDAFESCLVDTRSVTISPHSCGIDLGCLLYQSLKYSKYIVCSAVEMPQKESIIQFWLEETMTIIRGMPVLCNQAIISSLYRS